MKTTNFLEILNIILTGIIIFLVNNVSSNQRNTANRFNSDTTQKLQNFVQMVNKSNLINQRDDDVEIPRDAIGDARICFQRYLDTMAKHGFDTLVAHKRVTRSVSFGSDALLGWLNKVCDESKTNTQKIELRFGIYTDPYLTAISTGHPEKYRNRIGVFFWPVDGRDSDAVYTTGAVKGGEVSGFDLGGLHP